MKFKVNDLEFVHEQDVHPKIMKHFDNGHMSILHWYETSEGYEIRYVGSRPLESDIDSELLKDMMTFGQSYLDAHFKFWSNRV